MILDEIPTVNWIPKISGFQISGFQKTLAHFNEKKEGVEEEEASLHQENSEAERRMLALLTVFNSRVFLERQRLMQVFPEPVQKFWNFWELRVLVFVSLTLQLSVLHLGSRRRHSVKTWIKIFLWISYLSADSVATVALGVVSNNQGNSCDSNDSQLHNELIAFWAPFLLLHLGGPDTITAYALQDNELWLRHLLGLVFQSLVALYIFLLYWKANWLSFLTVLILLAGFIKYAERILVMRGISIPKVFSRGGMDSLSTEEVALKYFECYRCLYLNQTVNRSERAILLDTIPSIRTTDPQNTWELIELEHGYAYEFFYTKAPLFFTPWGLIFRFFSLTSIYFVFICFLLEERHKHLLVDLIITYLLLVGAILVETYGVILLSVSDWPWPHLKWLWKDQKEKGLRKHLKTLSAKLIGEQRWSNSMAQLNLLSFCLKDKSDQVGYGTPKLFANLRVWAINQMLPKLNGDLEKLYNRTHKQVSAELRELVYNTLWGKIRSNSNGFPEVYDRYINETEKMEIYHRIIIWHIATDLCFYENGANVPMDEFRFMIKDLSDYMMYILAMRPLVLSTGNAIRCFEKTCKSVNDFFQSKQISGQAKASACEALFSKYGASNITEMFQIDTYLEEDDLLDLAGLLANHLKSQMDRKWVILSSFWVENLAYVARLCQGNNHAQLLRDGGEFLTHVWLLTEHLKNRKDLQP